jgi:hypothetical protein
MSASGIERGLSGWKTCVDTAMLQLLAHMFVVIRAFVFDCSVLAWAEIEVGGSGRGLLTVVRMRGAPPSHAKPPRNPPCSSFVCLHVRRLHTVPQEGVACAPTHSKEGRQEECMHPNRGAASRAPQVSAKLFHASCHSRSGHCRNTRQSQADRSICLSRTPLSRSESDHCGMSSLSV